MYTPYVSPLVIFLAGFWMSVALYEVALRVFPRLGLLDFPQAYGLTRPRIPYPTGIVAIVVFLAALLWTQPANTQTAGIAAAAVLLGAYCFVDDRRKLPAWMRLCVQVLVAVIVFATGSRIYTITNPLEGIAGMAPFLKLDTVDIPTVGFGPLPLGSGVFTVLWLLLTVNALNWFDGITGQVNALSAIGFLVIALLAVSARVNQPELAALAFALSGIAAAGLLFDFPPGRMLLGDTGAMFFGLLLGVLTIHSGGKVATAFLVLGVPLIDSIIVIARRLLKGKSPLAGDQTTRDEHLHHRLQRAGWSDRRIIALTAVLGASFGTAALFLSTTEKFAAALVLGAILLALSVWARPKSSGHDSPLNHSPAAR